MKLFQIIFTVSILSLLSATDASAHDCWLQPDHFSIGLNTILMARLFVGHLLKADKQLSLEKAMTPRLDAYTCQGQQNLLTKLEEGCTPAAAWQADNEGPVLFVMDRDFTPIALENQKFEDYVTHERHTDLLPIIASRPDNVQNERYARCMKFYVRVEKRTEPGLYQKQVGQKLEIVLRQDPFDLRPGMSVQADIYYDGSPLSGKYVTAFKLPPGGQAIEETVKTDINGSATFIVDYPGIWLIRLVHLYPCKTDDEMDWESYWASYCFQIGQKKEF